MDAKNKSDEKNKLVIVNLNQYHIRSLHVNMEKVCSLFNVQYVEMRTDGEGDRSVLFEFISDSCKKDTLATAHEIQQYIEALFIAEAEDSSYDSDCDNDDIQANQIKIDHEKVSRTTSDTLGQEFAEYVNTEIQQLHLSNTLVSNTISLPGYTARVEFALKLGYTERLVQTALARLGPNPSQNELLAELIKLGALHNARADVACDSSNGECVALVAESISSFAQPLDINNTLVTQTNFIEESSTSCLRPIVVDGSNVAMSHGNKKIFSCRGIKLCIDWFKNRGHKDITVFVPKWRKESARLDNPIKDQDIMSELERERMLVFTPSRLVGGKRMVCYDDRYILKLAADNDGIVVSNDNYRDLVQESSEFKKVVEERVLMYSFVNDRFMPPDDPLGRAGPTLDNFLRTQPKKGDHPPPCPYGKKCTYGNKCKFNHPERGFGPHKSVTERLSEHAARHLSARVSSTDAPRLVVQGKSQSVPLSSTSVDCNEQIVQKPLCRTRSCVPEDSPSTTVSPVIKCSVTQQQAQISFWDPLICHNSNKHNSFSKSHSIENISPETQANSLISTQSNYLTLWPTVTHSISSSLQKKKKQQALSQNDTQVSTQEPADECINLHRKLKRQLTLNPSGCDLRKFHTQRCFPPSANGNTLGIPIVSSGHASPSGTGASQATQWGIHQCVTRIASAPDQSRPWHNGPPAASSSEPHINLWPHQAPLPILAAQDQRRRLHYHLSSIFPEDQVHAVMKLHPDETDPQRICAAILNMFPKL